MPAFFFCRVDPLHSQRSMKRLIAAFLEIPAVWVLVSVFVVSALETAVILGIFLPGELVIVLGGVLAARGHVSLTAVLAAGVAGPISGDVIGYILGGRYGEEIVRRKLGRRRWDRAHRRLSKKSGGLAIFVGRFLPFVRAFLPTTAGATDVSPGRFLPWDLGAAALWGSGSALFGYVIARDFERVLKLADRFSIGLGIALALGVAFWLLRGRRRSKA